MNAINILLILILILQIGLMLNLASYLFSMGKKKRSLRYYDDKIKSFIIHKDKPNG